MISNIKYPISSAIACSFVGSIGSSFIGIGPVASASYGFVTASTFLFFNYVSKDLIKNDSYRSRASLIAGNAVACGTLAFTATPITVPTTLILLITSIGGVLILEAFRTFHQNYQTQNKSTNNLELDRGSDDDDVWNSEEDGASSSDGEELPTNLISAKSPQSVKVDSAKEIEQASLKVWILAQIEKAKKSNEDEVDINADRVDHLNDFFSDLAQKGIISYYVEERSKWVTVKFTQPPKKFL